MSKHAKGRLRWTERAEFSGIPSHESRIPFAIERVDGGAVEPIADVCNFPPATAGQTERQRANAARLVDCWNACIDLPDPEAAVKGMREALESLPKYADTGKPMIPGMVAYHPWGGSTVVGPVVLRYGEEVCYSTEEAAASAGAAIAAATPKG